MDNEQEIRIPILYREATDPTVFAPVSTLHLPPFPLCLEASRRTFACFQASIALLHRARTCSKSRANPTLTSTCSCACWRTISKQACLNSPLVNCAGTCEIAVGVNEAFPFALLPIAAVDRARRAGCHSSIVGPWSMLRAAKDTQKEKVRTEASQAKGEKEDETMRPQRAKAHRGSEREKKQTGRTWRLRVEATALCVSAAQRVRSFCVDIVVIRILQLLTGRRSLLTHHL